MPHVLGLFFVNGCFVKFFVEFLAELLSSLLRSSIWSQMGFELVNSGFKGHSMTSFSPQPFPFGVAPDRVP